MLKCKCSCDSNNLQIIWCSGCPIRFIMAGQSTDHHSHNIFNTICAELFCFLENWMMPVVEILLLWVPGSVFYVLEIIVCNIPTILSKTKSLHLYDNLLVKNAYNHTTFSHFSSHGKLARLNIVNIIFSLHLGNIWKLLKTQRLLRNSYC